MQYTDGFIDNQSTIGEISILIFKQRICSITIKRSTSKLETQNQLGSRHNLANLRQEKEVIHMAAKVTVIPGPIIEVSAIANVHSQSPHSLKEHYYLQLRLMNKELCQRR